ncbi:MAG: hypothetical protein ACRDYC_05025, partial [Acidimicrobiales bacterium]
MEVVGGQRSFVVRSARSAAEIERLLASLDGSTGVGELARSFPDLVPSMLNALRERDMLVEGEGLDGVGRLTVEALDCSPGAVRAITRAIVAVLGCGPAAGVATLSLAKAGVGQLLLSDPTPMP